MHVLVIGAGLAGVTSAWYLRRAGFDVSVVEAHSAPALATSFANGGQISVSHPEPWANPRLPLQLLRWLGRAEAPVRLRPRLDWAQWRFALAFARECLPHRAQRNTAHIARLALHSLHELHALRAATGLAYEQQQSGILHLLLTPADFAHGHSHQQHLAQLGIRSELLDAEACVRIEPALAHFAPRLAGGLLGVEDESGNAQLFCSALATQAQAAGVRFYYDTRVTGLRRSGGLVQALQVEDAQGMRGELDAGAYVLCAGPWSPAIAAWMGERLPIYPVKGYSVTVPLQDRTRAPQLSITDEQRRIVCSRLGDTLRVAGMAEITGYDLQPDPARSASLLNWLDDRFPGAGLRGEAVPWCGLRPLTPNALPIIGKRNTVNLWYNTGHGTLGWTLACGSASLLTARMTKTPPPVKDFPPA